jgi:cytochrome c oxidase subunit 1
MYNETLGKLHFWLSAISINVTFFPQHFSGLAGMQRRVPDYAVQFTDFNQISTVGAFVFFIAQFIFIYNMLMCMAKKGQPATDQVWDGAKGLEWTVPSPAPYHTFVDPPHVGDDEHAAKAH